MISYSVPAAIALIFKLALLGYAVRSPVRNDKTRLFLLFLIILSLHNLSEFVGLNYFAHYGLDQVMEALGYSYFVTIVLFIAILLHLSLRLALDGTDPTVFHYALFYVPAIALELLLLFTDTVVKGFQPFQFTVIRDPGPWYFLFETYLTVYLTAAMVNLVVAARAKHVSSMIRARNRLWLVSLAPMALLMIYLIISRHMQWPQLPSTFYLPIAQAFFLLVATYATHQYRLFDIEFYIPGSAVRARKTVFYRRIQATVAEMAGLDTVGEALDRVSHILGCPVVLMDHSSTVLARAGDGSSGVAEFPGDNLLGVERITVAREIEQTRPELSSAMSRFHVAAIVPFYTHNETAASWLLLGDRFNDSVYTPLDFKNVERLFERLEEFFLDKLASLRFTLEQARQRSRIAEDELREVEDKLSLLHDEQAALRESNARLLRAKQALRRADDSSKARHTSTPGNAEQKK